MPRAIWKGAISFGLVHVPVGLYPASSDDDIDFDWLDKRSMDPVGYKRVNKRTGKEIDKDNIVKGVKQENGDYVLLSDDEIREAYPKTTQTIEIESFVVAQEIPFEMLERPYFLEPAAKAEKVYALLREAMRQAGVIGIGRVVMHTKEHLAAVIPTQRALMLNTLRWSSEMRTLDDLKVPASGKSGPALKDAELKMAVQLVKDMSAEWKPEAYADKFTDAIRELIRRKVKAGKTETVAPMEEAPETSSNVIDLTELLQRSLGRGKGKAAAKPASAPAAKKAKAATKSAAKKSAAK